LQTYFLGTVKNCDDKIADIENHFKKGWTGEYSSGHFPVKNNFSVIDKGAVIFRFLDNFFL